MALVMAGAPPPRSDLHVGTNALLTGLLTAGREATHFLVGCEVRSASRGNVFFRYRGFPYRILLDV